jgi:hypothetical protein
LRIFLPSFWKLKDFIIRNNTIHTASFNTPSPKRIENSLGSWFSFTKVRAATVSVETITEENNNISRMEKFNVWIWKVRLKRFQELAT